MKEPRLALPVLGSLLLGAACGFASGYTDNFFSRTATKAVRKLRPLDPRSNVIFGHITGLHDTLPVARITMIGDSLTQYGPWQRLLPDYAIVDNFGISGDTTRGVLTRTKDPQRIAPTVFLMIGVNDQPAGITMQETKSNIIEILKNLRSKRIYLQSTLPVSSGIRSKQLQDLSFFEKSACTKFANCTFIDVAEGMRQSGQLAPQFTTDGTHLSWAGYRHWASRLLPFMDVTTHLPRRHTMR